MFDRLLDAANRSRFYKVSDEAKNRHPASPLGGIPEPLEFPLLVPFDWYRTLLAALRARSEQNALKLRLALSSRELVIVPPIVLQKVDAANL